VKYKILPMSSKPIEGKDLKKYCTECGKKVKETFKFCPSCGTKV
jgi:rRNA maturation endonuclease Nob1